MPNQSQSRSSPILRIAVIGAGGIGSAFAYQLAVAGHHSVTVIARPQSTRFEQLRRADGIINVRGEQAKVKVSDALDDQIPYDVVIVTLQTHRLEAVMAALQRSAAKSILFMANNFEPEKTEIAVGPDRCCFGMPFIQARVDDDGKLNATIGAGRQRTKIGEQRWVDVFNAAGVPATFEPDMPLWLRCHVPLCVAFESASVAGVRRGGGASWVEALVIARGVRECFSLILGLGFRLYPPAKARLHGSPTWLVAAMLWFLSRIKPFRELLATGVDECRALVDVLVASAPQARPAVRSSEIKAMKPESETRKPGACQRGR